MKIDEDVIKSFEFPEPFEQFLLPLIGKWYKVNVRVNYFKIKQYDFYFISDNTKVSITEIRKKKHEGVSFLPNINPKSYGFRSIKEFDDKMNELKVFLELME